MNLVLTTVLLGSMALTSYRSVPNQTDSSPYITSIGERTNPSGVAVSRDLLTRWGGPLNYGDYLYIEGVGIKRVNDCMHERHVKSIDVWVNTYKEEKDFGVRKGRVWLIHPINRAFENVNTKSKRR